jgi:hypothetical protein
VGQALLDLVVQGRLPLRVSWYGGPLDVHSCANVLGCCEQNGLPVSAIPIRLLTFLSGNPNHSRDQAAGWLLRPAAVLPDRQKHVLATSAANPSPRRMQQYRRMASPCPR